MAKVGAGQRIRLRARGFWGMDGLPAIPEGGGPVVYSSRVVFEAAVDGGEIQSVDESGGNQKAVERIPVQFGKFSEEENVGVEEDCLHPP